MKYVLVDKGDNIVDRIVYSIVYCVRKLYTDTFTTTMYILLL